MGTQLIDAYGIPTFCNIPAFRHLIHQFTSVYLVYNSDAVLVDYSNVITLLFWQNTSCPSNMISYSWLTLWSKHIVCLAEYELNHWPHKALLAWEDELTTNKNNKLSISRPSTCWFLSYYQIRHLRMMTFMMTSSNGNIFRVTGHLCGEFTGPRWSPRTKASHAELWCFL